MAGLEKLKGITDKQIERLHAAGVRGTETLLKWGSTRDGRAEIAKKSRISIRTITSWVHRSDLMRIRGVDDDYARVLERAGVHSIVDLSTRNPMELAGEVEIAAAIEQVERVPRHKSVAKWIEEARHLLRHVWYHDTWGEDELTGRHPAPYAGPRVD